MLNTLLIIIKSINKRNKMSFPLGVWSGMWNSIVSVPVHCPFICLIHLWPEVTVVKQEIFE